MEKKTKGQPRKFSRSRPASPELIMKRIIGYIERLKEIKPEKGDALYVLEKIIEPEIY